jgi:L-rhamnonate dehydratase
MARIADVKTTIWEWLGALISECFPQLPVEVGNDLFWNIFDGEAVAEDGFINRADDTPGFGLTLETPDPENFKLTG